MTLRKDPKDFKKNGAPTKYKPEYDKKILDYFNGYINKISNKSVDQLKQITQPFPSFDDFAASIGVSEEIIFDWEKRYPSFRLSYKRSQQLIKRFFVIMGTSGVYHPVFAIFTAKNMTDMRDNIDLTSKGLAIAPSFVLSDNARRKGVKAS